MTICQSHMRPRLRPPTRRRCRYLPIRGRSSSVVLLGLGVLAALYLASSIILPVVLAFVLSLLLQPAVRLLGRVHLPRAVLTVLLVIGVLVGLVAALSVPASTWAERLPAGIPRLEGHLQVIKGPIEALQKVIQQAEQVADAPPSQLNRFGSPRSWPDGRTFRRDALRTRWPVYDCPGALFSFGSGRHTPYALLRSCPHSATSDRPSISLSRSRRTYRAIW